MAARESDAARCVMGEHKVRPYKYFATEEFAPLVALGHSLLPLSTHQATLMDTQEFVLSNLKISKEQLANFCQQWQIIEMALFGSALRDDFRENSDVDVMVTFAPDTRWTLFDLVEMQTELQELFGRDVDLMTRRSIESSHNHIRRRAILSSAEVVYAA